MRYEWRCIKMVNVNAITKRRELQLRREIMVWDTITKTGTINGIPFTDGKVVFAVFKVLLYQDFQSKLHGDNSILFDLIRDSKLTSILGYALGYAARDEDYPSMELLLPLGEIGEELDDMSIMTNIIDKLSDKQINDTFYTWNNKLWVDDKYRRAMFDIRRYLGQLQRNMIDEEKRVRDIVERELQTKTDGVGYDVKLKIGIKKNIQVNLNFEAWTSTLFILGSVLKSRVCYNNIVIETN